MEDFLQESTTEDEPIRCRCGGYAGNCNCGPVTGGFAPIVGWYGFWVALMIVAIIALIMIIYWEDVDVFGLINQNAESSKWGSIIAGSVILASIAVIAITTRIMRSDYNPKYTPLGNSPVNREFAVNI